MIWKTLANMLRVPERAAEDALKSERAARMTLSRRGLLLAGASAMPALALGNLWTETPLSLTRVLHGVHRDEVFDEPVSLAQGAIAIGCLFNQGIDKIWSANLVNSSIYQRGRSCLIEWNGSVLMQNVFHSSEQVFQRGSMIFA